MYWLRFYVTTIQDFLPYILFFPSMFVIIGYVTDWKLLFMSALAICTCLNFRCELDFLHIVYVLFLVFLNFVHECWLRTETLDPHAPGVKGSCEPFN